MILKILKNTILSKTKNSVFTYTPHIHHCLAAMAAADLNRDRPKRVTVGNIDNGPTNFNIFPTIPLAPRKISKTAAHIMDPCICNSNYLFYRLIKTIENLTDKIFRAQDLAILFF